MDKVVFVLSGFVNPLRGDLRDKALEMGAKYKGDWDKTCTHLVCAFLNTPKYLQVRGAGGKIVKKDWIVDCHKKKMLLPWKSYMLGDYAKTSSEESDGSDNETASSSKRKAATKTNGSSSSSQTSSKKRRAMIASDSDSEGEKTAPPTTKKQRSLFGDVAENVDSDSNPVSKDGGSKPKPSVSKDGGSKPKPSVSKDGSETEDEEALKDYLADTDVESDSGNDTEDEIRKVEEAAKRKKTAQKPASSDGEDSDSLLVPDTTNLPLPELPNLFKKRHFYLYGEFSSKTRRDLQRFITAYNGIVEEYMNDTIKYVVTEQGWDKNFEEALEENEDLIFVKPTWIFKCHEAQKLVPYQAFIVIPS